MSAKAEKLIQVKKVSLKYNSFEDRILMTLQSADFEIISLWLTLRMCRQLVPSLVALFDRDSLAKTASNPSNVNSVQGFLQQAAKNARSRTEPIKQNNPNKETQFSEPLLIDTLSIRTRRNAIDLLIPLAVGGTAVVPFTLNEARQWFDILFQQYKAASWPEGLWPDWVKSGAAAGSKSGDGQPLH